MNTFTRAILITLAALMALVFILSCGALFWIKSSAGRQWLQTRINRAIPGSLDIDGHQLSLMRLELALYGVTLRDAQGTPVAGVGHLVADLDWKPLPMREIRLDRLIVQAPWADLAVDASGRLNLTGALVTPDGGDKSPQPVAEDAGLPVNIACRSFQLRDGRLTFAAAGNRTELAAEGISLLGDGDLEGRRGGIDFEVDRLRYRSPGIRPQPAHITGRLRLEGGRLHVPAFKVTTGATTARLEGTVASLYTTPEVDGKITLHGRLSDLEEIFDVTGDFGGDLDAALSLRGTAANPSATLALTLEAARIAGLPADRLRLSMSLEDRQVAVSDAEWQLADGSIALDGHADLTRVFPSGFTEPPYDLDAASYGLHLKPAIPDLSPWLKSWMDMAGELKGDIAVNGRGVAPSKMSARATIEARGRRLLAPGMNQPSNADLEVSAQIEGGQVMVHRLRAATDGLTLTGAAVLGPDGRSMHGSFSLAAPDLSRALAVVGFPAVAGAVHGSLDLDGTPDRPQAALNLTATGLKVHDYTLGQVFLDADLDHEGRLHLGTMTLQNGTSRIDGTGRMRFFTGGGAIDPDFDNAADLRFTALSLSDFMASPPLEGTLNGRLTVNGPLTSLQGRLWLDGKTLARPPAAIGDLTARLRWDNGTVHMDHLEVVNHGSSFTASGSLELLAPGSLQRAHTPSLQLTAASDHFDPGDFVDAAGGDVAFDLRLAGSPGEPSGRVSLDGRAISAAGQSVDALTLDARIEDRRLLIDRFRASIVPGETIAVDGWIGLDRTMDLRIVSDGIAVGSIGPLKQRVPGNGVIRLDAVARGRIDNPDVEGRIAVTGVTVNEKPLDDMHLAFGLRDMRIEVAGDLNFGVDAVCDLRAGDFNLNLVFDDTETAGYFKAAGMPDLHGTLSGRIHAAGNIHDWPGVAARVDLSSLHLLSREISLIETDRVLMHLSDRRLTIPEFEAALLSTGSLRLGGEARLDGGLDLSVDGSIPVAAVQVFNPELAGAAGHVTVAGKLTGSLEAPLIDARVDFDKIAMPIPGLAQQLHDLNGRVHLTGDTIRIENLQGYLDTGSFSIDGTIAHQAFTPIGMDVAIDAKALPLEVPDTLYVLANGNITISGSDRTAEARGAIVVLEGLYYKDVRINLLKLATERQRSVAPAARPIAVPWFDTVALDIAVTHRQPFVVENNLAQLDISPNLKIGGTLARPIVSGRAQVQEGTVTFQKKTFDVIRGVIDFVNPYRTEPTVDIVSQARIRTWTITLTVQGTPDNLDLRLSSVPSETDADILSLILFGKTGRELTAGEGEAKRSTGQIMAELLADTFGDDIKKQTGVDILKVEGNGGGEDVGGVRVTVGKHLSDRMTVKYAVETKDGELVQRAITEYKLLENILVSGFQDSNGIYGSELVFRIEFR